MAKEKAPRTALSDVDGSSAANRLISYLDDARRSPAIISAKEWSLEALNLGPEICSLDVGCGTGEDVMTLSGRTQPGGRAVGVDVSATMIEEARRRHGHHRGVEFRTADATRLPFQAAVFDACRCERTLQHLEDPDAAVHEMTRVLRPGGRLALVEPDWGTLIIAEADPEISRRILAVHVRRHRQPAMGRRLRGLLTADGFMDIRLDAGVHTNTDLLSAARAFGLATAADVAVKAGVVSDEEASAWTRDLTEADKDQRLFAALTVFRASGRLGMDG